MVFSCTAESIHQRLFVQIVAMFLNSSLNNLPPEIKLEISINRNYKLYSYKLFTAQKKKMASICFVLMISYPPPFTENSFIISISKLHTANQLKTDQAFSQLFCFQACYL